MDKKLGVIIWSAVVSVVLSAFLHMVDPDVGEFADLFHLGVVFSVLLLALLPFGCMTLVMAILKRYGAMSGIGASILIAALSSALINAAMSTANLQSFLGLTLVIAVVFAIGATAPYLVFISKPS